MEVSTNITYENLDLVGALSKAFENLNISPSELKEQLEPEDLDDWNKGNKNVAALNAFAR